MYVSYVASNAKGVVSCNLGSKTLLIGGNGKGKTSVVNAVELALGGFASDVAGREAMAKESDLVAALTPERKGELFARAILDTGATVSWKAGGPDSKRAQHQYDAALLDPKTVFPLRMVRDAVCGNTETARKFFLGYAVPGITNEDVLREISQKLHPFYAQATLSTDIRGLAVDKLVKALEVASKKARGAKGAAKAQQQVAGAVASGLAPMPTDEQVAAAKAAQMAAKAALAKLDQQRGAVAERARMNEATGPLQHEIAQAEDNIRRFEELIAAADERAAAMPQPASLDAFNLKVIEVVREMAQREAGGVSGCPCCRSSVPPGTFTALAQRADAFIAGQAALVAPFDALRQEREELLRRKASWAEHLKSKRIELDVYQNKLAGSEAAPVDGATYDAAKAKLAECESNVTHLETIRAQWAQSRKAEDVAKDTTESSQTWAALRDEVKIAMGKLLDAGVLSFISNVAQYLPSGDQFGLKLHEEEKPVFRYGLLQGNVLRTALCGAEEARVLSAMASVCTPRDNRLSVIILPDRAFHPDTLASMMSAFARMPQQVILTSPVPPSHEVTGWTIVDTEAGEHRTATFP